MFIGGDLWFNRSVLFRCCRLLALVWVLTSAASAEILTIATYNIENYGPADRMTAEGYRKDYPKPETEKNALRRVIRGVNADVLVLQEMGAQPYLDELRRDLRAEGCDYPHAALATAADADRHIAILSKRPLLDVATLANLEFPYLGAKERVKRGVLRASVRTAAGDLTLFAVHLKSRFTERPDDPECTLRRAGEASAIRDAVLQACPDPTHACFIVLGDCNDAKTSKAVERLQHRGTTHVATLLPVADPNGETWTYHYAKQDAYERVDHLFVSPALQPAVVHGIATIYAGAGVREASDHRPVVVSLELPGR